MTADKTDCESLGLTLGGLPTLKHTKRWAELPCASSVAGVALAFALADVTNSNLFNARMGLVGWLLVAVAVTYATVSVRESTTVQARVSGAPAPVGSSRREAGQSR